jgi:ABC-2 type transport system ATP-binding protein
MNNEIIFETNNLSKNYGKVKAIRDLSLKVLKGQVYGILGPNGSGKTTTLSIGLGILQQNSGTYSWFEGAKEPAVRKRIGSLIEIPHFYPYMSLQANLQLVARIKALDTNDIERVLKVVRLYDRRNSKFQTMSLGMKQRLGIGAALLGDPEVLVLDEPTNGLDPEGIAEVRELIINEAARGKTIIIASHILSEVEKVCSHVAILKNGVLLEQGNVKALLGSESLIEINAANRIILESALKDCPFVNWIKSNNENLLVTLTEGHNAADLNAYLFSRAIVLNSIVNLTKSLESQFLELVKEDKP